MALYEVPRNFDATGKLQHALKTKDVVLCLCYQPPGLQYNHPNLGSGTYSQAVFVVDGNYTSRPDFRASGLDRDTIDSDILHISKGQFVNLEHLRNITLHDTAGPNGVMMVHVNPISGNSEFNFEFVGPNESRIITTNTQRKMVFCFKEEVSVNGAELLLLNRMRLKPNTETLIETGENGTCLIMENKPV